MKDKVDATWAAGGEDAVGEDRRLIARAIARARTGDPNALRFLYVCFAHHAEEAAAEVSDDTVTARRLVRTTFLQLPSTIRHYRGQGQDFEAWLVAQITEPERGSSLHQASRGPTPEHGGRIAAR